MSGKSPRALYNNVLQYYTATMVTVTFVYSVRQLEKMHWVYHMHIYIYISPPPLPPARYESVYINIYLYIYIFCYLAPCFRHICEKTEFEHIEQPKASLLFHMARLVYAISDMRLLLSKETHKTTPAVTSYTY